MATAGPRLLTKPEINALLSGSYRAALSRKRGMWRP